MTKLLLLFLALCATTFGEIKAIVFDYGGVIVNFDNGPASILWNDRSCENWEECFHQAIIDGTTVTTGIFELIDKLKESGYFVALFSNVTEGAASHIRRMGYYEPFEVLFLSYEMGCAKPQRDAYTLFLAGMPFAADEILFIDDRIENVEAAIECGIHALHFTNFTKLLADLKDLSIVNYTIEKRQPTTLVGIEKRIENHQGIGEHWEAFFACKDQIPHKASDQMYGLYTNYEGDHTNPYSLICGCPVSQVDEVPDGFQVFEIPEETVAHFASRGESPSHIYSTWQTIWNTDLPRLYSYDYEIYEKDFRCVDIYVAIAD